MGSGERDLKEQLMEAGKALLQPPSSADELLSQLERVGKLLGRVDQSPSELMLEALSPIIKAVVEEELLRNQSEDVRVAVASCISEITRITAPEAPYDDNQMKEVFQLIVSSFEDLSDKSSPSYSKRTSILETVAKVRSCVVMLDLECDDLIVEMFQHFLKAIRDDHPDNVFSNMETIMTLVLEESEDIGLDIISPLLACLKKDNQEVQSIAQKLAENVIGNCAEKIKPCLLEAKSSMNLSFDDYSAIISTICMETNHTGHGKHKLSGELQIEAMANGTSSGATTQGDGNKLTASSDQALQLTKESKAYAPDGLDHDAPVESGPGEDHSAPIETGPGEDHPVLVETGPGEDTPAPVETFSGQEHPVPVELGPVEDLPAPATPSNSATCNGVAENEEKDISVHLRSEKPQHTSEEDQSHDANASGKAKPVDSDSGKVAEVEPKSAQISKKRSTRTKRSTKSTVPSESSHTDTDTDKETKRVADGNVKLDKEVHASPSRDPSIKMAAHEENERETRNLSPPKAVESEPENVFSPSPSGSKLDEGRLSSRKGGRSKKKNKFSKKASPSEDVVTKKTTGGTDNSEVKLLGRSGKKAQARDSPAEKIQVPVKTSGVEEGSGSDSDAKLLKTSTKKADTRNHTGDGSSSKKKIDDKKRVRGKTTLEKEVMSSPKPSKAVKDDSPLEETPKANSKRKRASSKATYVKKHGEHLVGARIKVWWPIDKTFYEGVVDSFDPKNKKHKVKYTDGELEHLNLGNEKWELIEDGDSREDGERETKAGCPDTFPGLQKKKKAKTGSEPLATKGKTGTSRDGVASSSRSKGTAKKSSGKSVDDSKDDGKLAEATSKSSGKSEDAGGKSKARSKKAVGRSAVDASEKAGKTKDEDSDTPKTIVKFKLGSPKSLTKDSEKGAVKDSIKTGSKSHTSKIGSKSSSNGAGKVKSGSAKSKETDDNEKSPEVVKASKSGKSKLLDTPKRKQTEGKSDTRKGKETEGKSEKKRRKS